MTLMTTDVPAALGGAPVFDTRIPITRPSLGRTDLLALRHADILTSGILANGPTVRELEDTVAARLGVPHVIGVSSCTSGLMLVLEALEATGSVVMPSLTSSASAHAVARAGGTPVFAEVAGASMTLDPEDAEDTLDALGGTATAMTATHLHGTPCRTEALQVAADRARIPLVYDAAHALGSVRRGMPVGGFGTAEVFSLSTSQVVVAGEGGLVATHDAALARAIRLRRDQGNAGEHDCRSIGLNARMSELHAATALHSLGLLDRALARRRAMVDVFWRELGEQDGIRGPALDPGDVSTHKHLAVVLDEDAYGLSAIGLVAALATEGIDSRCCHWPPVHHQQAYAHLPRRALPLTERLARSVVSLPLWSHMTDEQVRGIAGAVRRILAHAEEIAARTDRAQR